MTQNDVVAAAAALVSIRTTGAGTAPTRPMPPTADASMALFEFALHGSR